MSDDRASRLSVVVAFVVAWACVWGVHSIAGEFAASPLFELSRRSAVNTRRFLGEKAWTRVEAIRGRPAPALVCSLDMDEVAEACRITFETPTRPFWRRKAGKGAGTAKGDLEYTVFNDRKAAVGKLLERMQWGAPLEVPAGERLLSPSGREYGDIAFWFGTHVRYVSANVYAHVWLSTGSASSPRAEDTELLEEILAAFDAYVRRELAEQNARAQAILHKVGLTARVALDDKGGLWVSGEVVCLSSDFPRYMAQLLVPKGSKRVVVTKRETAVVEIEPTAEIERTRMYRHSFAAGPYAVPEEAGKGTLELVFRDEGGVVFGNRWRLVFGASEPLR